MSMQYDFSRIGAARREAIRALDDYGCTPAEQRRVFGVPESTFHRYAYEMRLRRRPSQIFFPGCTSEAKYDWEKPLPPTMPRDDALEIVTIAMIKSRSNFSVNEIVKALGKTSKSAVYRQRQAYIERFGILSPAEVRWHSRHLPSHLTNYLSPAEKTRETKRHERRWVTRARKQNG